MRINRKDQTMKTAKEIRQWGNKRMRFFMAKAEETDDPNELMAMFDAAKIIAEHTLRLLAHLKVAA